MSITTVAEAIKDLLETEWNLAAPLAAEDIHFDCGWLDRQWIGFSDASPQVIVSGPMASPIRFFGRALEADLGHHLLSHGFYVVNVWVRIPSGADGDIEEDYAESMRKEAVRILNEYSCSITDPTTISMVKPLDDGRALHQLQMTPRVLRFEITCFANWQS